MAKASCSNTEGYASPMPIIGLYIAGASLVCLILMLCDILFGLRHKIRYIPCRFFSLNSITLTLLGIVSKLPVDLTSEMPSAKDQLSKLTGTTMVCICIGFMMPSIASSGKSESITNVAALSILVVTIIVNICIQLATGVIFSFIVEQIVILCVMLMLVFILWNSNFKVQDTKYILTQKNKELFEKGETSLMHRAKRWYMFNCIYNPQLVTCRDFDCFIAGVISLCCSVVLLEATLRSLVLNNLEFCQGSSDYGWSMWLIIITQIVSIIIGTLTIAFRIFSFINNITELSSGFSANEREDFTIQFSFMKRRSMRMSIMVLSRLSLKFGLTILFVFIFLIVAFIPLIIAIILKSALEKSWHFISGTSTDVSIELWEKEFKDVRFADKDDLPIWMMKICVKNMNNWTNIKRDSPSYMVQMLSRHCPSTPILLNKIQNIGKKQSSGYKVTCLSTIILVKVAFSSMPSVLTKSMRCTLSEAFKVIYYIDEKINVGGIEDPRKRELAKLVWTGGDIHINKKVLQHSFGSVSYAISNIENACEILPKELAEELKIIRDFILDREYASIEELCNYIEQLFVDMLHFFFSQLPNCIFKEVNECPIEDCEARARTILKFLCELESSLEDKVQWIFPGGANIASFMDSQDSNIYA